VLHKCVKKDLHISKNTVIKPDVAHVRITNMSKEI